jgi:hypothetical protein
MFATLDLLRIAEIGERVETPSSPRKRGSNGVKKTLGSRFRGNDDLEDVGITHIDNVR